MIAYVLVQKHTNLQAQKLVQYLPASWFVSKVYALVTQGQWEVLWYGSWYKSKDPRQLPITLLCIIWSYYQGNH